MILQPTYCLISKPGNELSYGAYVNPLGKVCTACVHCTVYSAQIGFIKKIIHEHSMVNLIKAGGSESMHRLGGRPPLKNVLINRYMVEMHVHS